MSKIPNTEYSFVIEGTDIVLKFSRKPPSDGMEILRDDTVQTVKKKLIMELNRVYPTDVAYEELFLTGYVASEIKDTADFFRSALREGQTALSRSDIERLCRKHGSNVPDDNKDKYKLADFVGFFKPTRKLVVIGATYAEHKYPFFIPHPSELNEKDDVELDFSETQLLFQYGELVDNVIHVNIAQTTLSKSQPEQHERILRTFYRALQYSHGIVSVAQLNDSHNALVANTNAAITEKTERAFNSVQLFHDIYNTRTEEMPWTTRGISSVSFSVNHTYGTNTFPLESIFKSVHSSRSIPMIKYTPGNRREPIYRIYSERVSPNGQKIAFLHEKKITKLAREMGRAGQVSLYIQCKRDDIALFLHFDRNGQIVVDCDFAEVKTEEDAVELIRAELNTILELVGKDTPGLKLPEFSSLHDVDILRMKYVMNCEITNNVVFKNIPCLNSIMLVETNDVVAGATLRYIRVENYREMNAQTMFINDNRDDVPTLMNGLMRNFGMSEEEARMRIIAFFNEHADIRGKIIDNPGFMVDMRIPRMESHIVITVDRITSMKYIDLLHIYFDSILRLSQKPKTTAITKEHMVQVCSARDKKLIDTAAVVQNLPAKPVLMRPDTFNLFDALGIETTVAEQEYQASDDDGVFFDDEDVESDSEPLNASSETPKEPSVKAQPESFNASSETPKEPSVKAQSESLGSFPEVAKSESFNASSETPKEPSVKAQSESLGSFPEVAKSESFNASSETPKEPSAKAQSESLGSFPEVAKSESFNASSETPKEPSATDVCLLFLTYEDVIHADKLKEMKYFDNEMSHIYIHAKYPNRVNPARQKYIIPTIVPTEWGNDSIVHATVELIKHALKQHPTSKWFVLLSQDVYPLLTFDEFSASLSQSEKSKFNVRADTMGYIRVNAAKTVGHIYKTSQWWALNAEDAARLVNGWNTHVLDPSRLSGAIDENYVLTTLMSSGTSEYDNRVVVYDEWLQSSTSLHPTLFNSLLQADLDEVKNTGAAFMRKTTPSFTDNIRRLKTNTITVAVIGTETNQANLFRQIGDSDFICVVIAKMNTVLPEIVSRAIKLYNCIWSDINNAMREVYFKCIQKYGATNVVLLNETGNRMQSPTEIPPCKLKYIHITKTGGTSVEESGVCRWGKYDADIREATTNIWCKDYAFWHIPPRYFHADKLQDMMRKHDLFATVRNPFDRVISEYYCKWGGPKHKTNDKYEFNAWILDTLTRLHTDIQNGVLVSGHWVPQYLYFTDGSGREIIPSSRRIKLEQINKDLPEMLRKYSIQIDLKKENESRNKRFGVSDLSPDVIKMILRIYEKDFSMLGYSTNPGGPITKPLYFGGVGDSEIDAEDVYKQDPTGMPLKNPNPFLKRLKLRDPRLFLTRDDGKYRAYSTKCQPTDKQPVILTDEEKEKIDRENPGSYKHALKYGTDKDHQFWYICPRYWCFRTNTSITEEDVKAGKCGRVITEEDIKRGKIPADAHVYEFNNPKTHMNEKGKYIDHYPGFVMKDDMHPDGFCLPCCMKDWDSGQQGIKKRTCLNPAAIKAADGRTAAAEVRQQLYIMASYPLPNGRWGFLPTVASMFFGIDYKPLMDKSNTSMVIPGQSVFLRCGVEQPHGQSFLGVFADIYSYLQKKPEISVEEFRKVLLSAITLDVFVGIHNASLPQIFRDKRKGKVNLDKYRTTEFYRRLSVADDKDHRVFFEDAVLAYENFQRYLNDVESEIDHTFLWDIFCAKLPTIHPDGVNLVMLEILDNDATEKIELVCPTNVHSANSFDPKKQTVFVLKREEFYEPIYLYRTDGKEIFAQKTFTTASLHPNVKQIINMVGKITGKYCAPLTSLPKVYKFKPAISAHELVQLLGTEAKTAVVNYRNKVVGIFTGKTVIPCYPSSLTGMDTMFMDELELCSDYETTRDELMRVNSLYPKINCTPAFKVIDEGLVVGIITLTNQFVQINPPSENVLDDGVEIMENPNWNEVDIASVKGQDKERVKMSKWILLESQFYSTFQTVARELLNDPIRSDSRERIIRIGSSNVMDHTTKVKDIERVLRKVMGPAVEFAEMDDGFLLHLDSVSQCGSKDETPYCVIQDDGTQTTLFPSKHLLSGIDNETVYYGRLADQLVRYGRVKAFILYPEQSINLRPTEYNLDENEMLLVHSDITADFFRRIDSRIITPYAKNTTYEFAQPSITQYYSRDTIPFETQYNIANVGVEQTLECVKPGLIPIVGNTRSMWVQSFPKTAREKVFLASPECTFHIMITVLKEIFNKPVNVAGIRKLLWAAYAPHIELHSSRIVSVLKAQGKHTLMEAVEHGRMTLETLIFSESYYLSDLDIWVMATRYNLPIIIFTSTYLKGMKSRISWLRAGGAPGSNYYFIRSGTTTDKNNIGEYHLVVPTMPLTGLGEFSEQFRTAQTGDNPELAECIISLDAFLGSGLTI